MNAVSIPRMGWMTGQSWFNSSRGLEIHFFTTTSRTPLGRIHRTECLSVGPTPEDKAVQVPRLRMCGALTPSLKRNDNAALIRARDKSLQRNLDWIQLAPCPVVVVVL